MLPFAWAASALAELVWLPSLAPAAELCFSASLTALAWSDVLMRTGDREMAFVCMSWTINPTLPGVKIREFPLCKVSIHPISLDGLTPH